MIPIAAIAGAAGAAKDSGIMDKVELNPGQKLLAGIGSALSNAAMIKAGGPAPTTAAAAAPIAGTAQPAININPVKPPEPTQTAKDGAALVGTMSDETLKDNVKASNPFYDNMRGLIKKVKQ